MEYFKSLRARHWAWLHFMASVGIILPAFLLLNTSRATLDVVDAYIVTAAFAISIVGTVGAMAGYFLSQQIGKAGVIGISIELSGLILSALGPLTYFISRFVYMFAPESRGLDTGIILAYVLCSIYLYRFIIVVPRFRFEAHDPSKE